MRFDFPEWGWAVPPALAYLFWLHRRSYAQLAPAARRASLAGRALILALVAGALSQPSVSRRVDRGHLVFLVDVSRSVTAENLEAALDEADRLAREASASPRPPAAFSAAVFGERAKLASRERPAWGGWPPDLRERILHEKSLPSLNALRARAISEGRPDEARDLERRIRSIERFRDETAGEHTDIAGALRLALNCGSTGDRKTVYVFTDGNFDRGSWAREWAAAAAAGASVHAVRLNRPAPPEAAAAAITLPPRVRVHQGFTAEVHVASTAESEGRLSVFKDGFLLEERDIRLSPGSNAFKLPSLSFDEKGFHSIEAAVKVSRDTRVENNRVRAIVSVPGEARVLYVDRDESQIPYLKSALELEGLQVEARPAGGVPHEIAELLSFDAFILSNVPSDRLTLRQMEMIRSYVRDFGGGFIMLGGEESFGLGGYYNTPVEDILPVRMPVSKEANRPTAAILLVIDKSGSMEGVKIQLAKRAAIATSEAIHPRDQIGVVGFDSESRVLLELTTASDRATVASRISTLDAGGGTFLYPALEDARQLLSRSSARRRHIIVLSDGQTQGHGYVELVQAIAADGITLSSVGIGEDADVNLLESIARTGGGRAYFTNDFNAIPQIFTREALRASKSMLVEQLVRPAAVRDDPCLKEIDAAELPLLMGYVATTPKPAARTVIVSDSGDPILARWRHGLGWTAAFTSETKPRWAEDWLEWPDFAKFWGQLVRSLTGQDLGQSVSVECAHAFEEGGALLRADVRDASDRFLPEARVELAAVDAQGRSRAVAVEQRGPGLFEARWPEAAYGRDQQFVWTIRRGEAVDRAVPYGFVSSFSPEYHTLGPADEVFEQMAARRAGEVMDVGKACLVPAEAASGRERVRLWPWCLAAALLLVPLDILVRRLG